MANTPQSILTALQAQFGIIRKSNEFLTDIGSQIFLSDLTRTDKKVPSISIGTPGGQLNRRDEAVNGKAVNSKARSVDLIIEAAVKSVPDTYLTDGLAMLEDIEVAWARSVGGVMAPAHTGQITLDTWTIIDRPAGLAVTMLQILGTATYRRGA